MKLTMLRYVDAVLSSYWFIPTLMAVGAVALSFAMVALDLWLGSAWLDEIEWVYPNEPSGARELLSTIAGSVITVAGVAFSITTVTVAQTAGQFGPRLLTNFMQNRGNQITLGTFIATFLYCLLVLRTVRSEANGADAFVPHIAVFGALFLALASVAVLIYFIHHVPESIHVSNLVGDVGRQLNRRLDEMFPTELGRGEVDEPEREPGGGWPERFEAEARPVHAAATGYVLLVDGDGLMACAREHDLRLVLRQQPGSFVSDDRVLALVWPGHRLDDGMVERIRRGFVIGIRRTPAQDVSFFVHRLVEVAGRALSPGVNDVFTATSAMDWLGAALAGLAGRRVPSADRYDEDGALRVIAEPLGFEGFAAEIFGQLRPYVRSDPNAALHLMKIAARVAEAARTPAQRAVLLRHATALRDGCDASLTSEHDRAAIHTVYAAVVARLDGVVSAPVAPAKDQR